MVFTVYKKLENLTKKKKSIIKDWSDKTKAKVNIHEDICRKQIKGLFK